MNRIVREHYPVSNLPEDLQKEFPGQDEVTLVLEAPVSSEQATRRRAGACRDQENWNSRRRLLSISAI